MTSRLYIQFADNDNIRKWQREPFEGGTEYIALSSPASKAESGWRPIETAPKDGTRVLVARFAPKPQHRNGYMCVDWWRDRERDDVSYTGFGGFNNHYWPATHWMPLPTPPSASNDGEEK